MPRDGHFAEDSQENIGHKIGLVLPKLYHPPGQDTLRLKETALEESIQKDYLSQFLVP